MNLVLEVVGEEEVLLLVKVSGDGVLVLDSGECSSGDWKEENNNYVSLKLCKIVVLGKKKVKVDWMLELY